MTGLPAVYWLIQTTSDVPGDSDWLSPGEREVLGNLRYVKRRADWRLGRWTAKRAVFLFAKTASRPAEATDIEIIAAEDGAPEAHVSGKPVDIAVSISHSGGVGFCVVAVGGLAVGCDVELAQKRSDRFVADYFTPEEAATVTTAPPDERAALATLIWSAKESALKVMRKGLSRDTRSVAVEFERDADGRLWNRLQVAHAGPAGFEGWWRQDGDLVFTLLADTPIDIPVPLNPDPSSP